MNLKSGTIGHIGVFTSGGDSPGMNAAIRAVVRSAVHQGCKVTGIVGGYDGLVHDRTIPLGARDVGNIIQRGGTILRSARSEAFRTPEGRAAAAGTVARHGIDGLVAIGGDGTFTGANILWKEHGVRTIGLPGTIDNDLWGTDFTIGYDTAVNTAVEAIDKIRDTASSHDRLFFVEVMGRDTGFIALASALASGAEYVMVPEELQSLDDLVASLNAASKEKTSSIVVVAEGDEEGGAFDIARKTRERMPQADIRVTVLGHLQRGGSPTANDRILASRLGVAAVEGLLAERFDQMAGVVNGELVFTPFTEAIGRRKPLAKDHLRILSILSV
jgi:6-phosphofructokinase 1